nr:MAG TPA: hypothetical protein [Caudoviricetes sp.]
MIVSCRIRFIRLLWKPTSEYVLAANLEYLWR